MATPLKIRFTISSLLFLLLPSNLFIFIHLKHLPFSARSSHHHPPLQIPKMPSIVWDYFDEFEGGGKCRLCGCIRNRKDKSTSTFWQHLERVHGLDKRQMMMGGGGGLVVGGGSGKMARNSGGQQPADGGLFSINGMLGMGGGAEGGGGRTPQGGEDSEVMPKLDLVVDGLGLDQRATEETFRFISELVKQQQLQQQQQQSSNLMSAAMPSLEPADNVKRELSPYERQVITPIGINKRNNDLVANNSIFGGGSLLFASGDDGKRSNGAKKRKMGELPPTPPPSQLYNNPNSTTPMLTLSSSTPPSSSSSSSSSSTSLLNNYLSGILDFANSSPLNLTTPLTTNSLIPSPSPSFASPVPLYQTNQMPAGPHQTNGGGQETCSSSTFQLPPNNDEPPAGQGVLGIATPTKPQQQIPIPTSATQNQTPKSPDKKREDYLSWDTYFMGMALLTAQRSKDPVTQVGACIVKDSVISGVGYNGMPYGCHDDEMPWGKDDPDRLKRKYLFVCHAEMNAIVNKNCADIKGATMYTTLFPCSDCAKLIIQSHIKRVVYLHDKKAVEMEASRILFNFAGIEYSKFEPTCSELVLRFK